MASRNKAELIIEGTDKTGKAFSSVDKKLSLTQKKSKALGLGFESLTKRTGRLGRGLGGLVGPAGIAALALVGIGTAVTKALSSAIKFGDELDKTSKKLDITSEELQLYRRALEFAGVQSSTFEAALLKMQNTIGQAGMGVARAKDALEGLGITLDELGKLSTIQRFELINERISAISDSSARAALETRLYGTSGQELNKILGENAAAFNEQKDAIEKTATFLSNEATPIYANAADNVIRMGQAVKNATASFLNFFAVQVEGVTALGALLFTGTITKGYESATEAQDLFLNQGQEGNEKLNALLLKQQQLNIENSSAFKMAAETGRVLFRGLNDGLGQFIDGNATLSESFSFMAKQILTDILKMIVEFAILNAAAALFKSLSGGAVSGVGFAGGLSKALNFSTLLPTGTRASGGPVSKGNSFLVGEKGPELFIPNTSGNITPNSRLGSDGVVVNNSFELINQSNTPLQGRMVSEKKADGEGDMVRIYITDLRNNGPMSRATATRFGLSPQPR